MLKINPEQEIKRIVNFIQTTLKQQGFKKVIVALSGGVDSSTTLTLAVRALGKDNVLVTILPYGEPNEREVEAALLMIKLCQIPPKNLFKIDIKPMVDSFLAVAKDADKLRKGNIIARVRMVLLFDLSKKHQALVCGTENKSEYLLGYYTRFGDEASDLEPLRNLYKTQVKKLAEALGVPKKIINKPPSAGLWQGQTDEKELGFSYEEADPILSLHFDKKYSWGKIVKTGFSKKIVEKVKCWVKKNEFKRRTPIVAKI